MNKKIFLSLLLALALTLSLLSADDVRVGLRRVKKSDNRVTVSFSGKHAIYEDMQSSQPLFIVDSANSYQFSIKNGNVIVADDQALFAAPNLSFRSKKTVIKSESGTKMKINGVTQIGGFLLGIDANNTLIPVIVLDREQYLKGVVPKEMSASAPLEALKAQAVAARTFSIRQMNRFDSDGYDICDTPACQVYGGVAAHHQNSNLAVEQTAGLCVAYRDFPANTFYHANSGGYVENSEDIFASPLAYIKADKDPYSLVKPYNWSAEFDLAELTQKMIDKGYDIGSVKQIKIAETLPSGRVVALKVIGDRGETTLQREKIRSTLGYAKVKSLLFSIETDDSALAETKTYYMASSDAVVKYQPKVNYAIAGDDKVTAIVVDQCHVTGAATAQTNNVQDTVVDHYVLQGSGWGHGLGMSQVGAVEMAKQGFSFSEILKFYYKNTELLDTKDLKDENK